MSKSAGMIIDGYLHEGNTSKEILEKLDKWYGRKEKGYRYLCEVVIKSQIGLAKYITG